MRDIPTVVRNVGTISSDGAIGFSSAPDKVRERSIIRGFEMNILVVGRRGLGCSTLINSVFAAPLVDKKRPNTVTVTRNEIVENDICLETSIITYHGSDMGPALGYIDAMNREYFDNEQGLYKAFKDNRVHVCLYLIPSDMLTEDEVRSMYELSQKCNLVPVIPKADMYTPEELSERKEHVRQILANHNVDFFMPHVDGTDTDLSAEVTDIAANMPLAVISSETMYDHDGEILRGRRYPWGFINIESEEGNDFKRLQRLLVHTNMDELITRTNCLFYNGYRRVAFDLENDCTSMREARYARLRTEMLKILGDRHEARIEALRREEEEMERFYTGKIDEACGRVGEVEEQIEKMERTLQI